MNGKINKLNSVAEFKFDLFPANEVVNYLGNEQYFKPIPDCYTIANLILGNHYKIYVTARYQYLC